MQKKLADMSLEELWQLFPIVLTKHQACWKKWFEEERDALLGLLPSLSEGSIHHIGSTAIPGIAAKPIIDILAEFSSGACMQRAAQILTETGWLCMSSSGERISLNKGYTERGFARRVFHMHLRLAGDTPEIAFRDFLCGHPEKAREYEALKLALAPKFRNDRDGYTQAKSDFVRHCMDLAANPSPAPV